MAEKLIIEVNLVRGDTKSAFKKIEKQAGQSSKAVGGKFASALKGAFAGFVGLQAITRAFGAFNRQIKESITTLRAFTRSVGNANSILPEQQQLLRKTTNEFRNFAAQYATSSARQADAFYSIVSAGIKTTSKQLEVLQIANEAAVAGLVDINESARLLVSSINAYSGAGLSAKRASDILFAGVREGQITFQELANFLGNTTSIAFSAGAAFDELVGTLAFVTKAGIQTDRAIIGLRQVFTSVVKVTKQAEKAAKDIGLQFDVAAIKSKGFAGFLKDVAEKTKGNTEVLGKLFGNVRALNPILAVVNGDFEDFLRIQKEVAGSLDDTARAGEKIRKTLDFKLDQLNSSFRVLAEELAEKLAPALIMFADWLTKIIVTLSESGDKLVKLEHDAELLREQIKKFEEMGDPFQNITIGLNDVEIGAVRSAEDLATLRDELKRVNRAIDDEKLERFNKNLATVKLTRATARLKDLEEKLLKINKVAEQPINFRSKQDQLLGQVNELDNLLKTNVSNLEDTLGKAVFNPEKLAVSEEYKEKLRSQIRLLKQEIMLLQKELTITPKVNNKNLKDGAKDGIDWVDRMVKSIQRSLQQGLEKTTVQVFSRIGAQLKIGQDAWKNWEAAMLDILGDMMIQIGTAMLGIGKAITALELALKKVSGGLAIAAGLALITLGGFMKSVSGTLTSAAKGDSGGSFGGGNTQPNTLPEPEDIERLTSSEINITVEGSLVQQEELGQFLSDVISESNEKNGNVILNQRFA